MRLKFDYKLKSGVEDGSLKVYLPQKVIHRASVSGLPSVLDINLPEEHHGKTIEAYILNGGGRLVLLDVSAGQEPFYLGYVRFVFRAHGGGFRSAYLREDMTFSERAIEAHKSKETKNASLDQLFF